MHDYPAGSSEGPMTNGGSRGRAVQSPGVAHGISRLRKKGKVLSRSVLSLNCLGGIRHMIGQCEQFVQNTR